MRLAVPAWLRGRAELGLAALVIGLGIYLLVETGSIRVPQTANAIGPRFFPYLVGGMLVITGIALGVMVWRRGSDAPEEAEDVDPTLPTDWRTLGLLVGAFIAHILLLEPLGFVFTEALLFTAVAGVLGASLRRLWIAGLAGLVLSTVVFLVFARGLGVTLPAGVLEGVL